MILLASLDAGSYAIMIVYMLAIVAIGFWFSRDNKTTDSYLLGSRSMSWWVIGISYVVSLLSTLTMVGVPGEAYVNGLTMSIGTFLLPIFAVLAFHIFVRFYFVSDVFTPFDYLERRFDLRVRLLAAGFFWISRTIYIGLVLYASAKVFAGADDWPVWKTILLIGCIGTFYTLLGGLRAVVWSDFVQFIVLAAGIILILGKAVFASPGGATEVITYAFDNGRGFNAFSEATFYSLDPYVRVTLWTIVIATLSEQLFFASSDQIALQRLLSTSGYAQAKRSMYTAALLIFPVLAVLWFIGLAMFRYYGELPIEQRPESGDLALFQFIAAELPPPMPGLVLAAMLAAIMSTLDSGINSLATVATKDFYVRIWRPSSTELDQVRFSRILTLVVGVLAIGIGLGLTQLSSQAGATVLETTMAWLALSVALPPVFFIGMISHRATARVAVIQLLAGWVTTAGMLIWYIVSQRGSGGGISFLVVGVPGPVISLILAAILSRFQPVKDEQELSNLTFWTLSNPDAHIDRETSCERA